MSGDRRPLVVLGAPMESEALLEGVNRMPEALRAAGLIDALGAADLGDLPIRITDPERDPVSGLVAYRQIVAATAVVRAGVAAALERPGLPLVVGGCCGILVGIFAALQAGPGRTGLAFADGHYDFYDAATSPAGALADTELRVLTGSGPEELVAAGSTIPLLRAEDAWVLGVRDGDEMADAGAPDPVADLVASQVTDDAAVRHDPARAGRRAAAGLEADPGRFWLHLDLDVLSVAALPAVDYHLPGGLDWDELAALLRPLAASPALLGMDVTIYNPSLDPGRAHAPRIVELLREVLSAA
jgi:arginase